MFRVRNLVNTTTTTYYNNETHMHVHVAEREWYVTKEGEHNEKREGFKKRNEKQEEKEMQKKRSTGPSRVVLPHRSTTPARTCLNFAVRMGSGEPG